jgi:hypothetical protein
MDRSNGYMTGPLPVNYTSFLPYAVDAVLKDFPLVCIETNTNYYNQRGCIFNFLSPSFQIYN